MASKPILFFISHGHGDGADKGAVSGKFVELELTKKVAAACYAQLLETPASKRNWKVDYGERKVNGYSLAEQQKKVERYQDKYRTVCVDIHFNAGHGDGSGGLGDGDEWNQEDDGHTAGRICAGRI